MLRICLIPILMILSSCTTVTPYECYWYEPVKLSQEDKDGLSREGKEQIAFNNTMFLWECD